MKSVKEHIHRDYNLNIPMLNDHFTVLDFTYDMPLTTYLGQVLNSSAKVPKISNLIVL